MAAFIQGILKRMFRLRDQAAQRRPKGADEGFDAEEKPFLDHLEDLRVMFFKMLGTVVVAVVVASIFHVQLMELIQLPMKWAGIGEPDAIAAVFNLKQPQSKSRFHPGDLVVTGGGLLANVVSEDTASGVTKLKLADGVEVSSKTDSILGAIPNPGAEVNASDLRRLSPGQLMVMETFQPAEGLMIVLKLIFLSAMVGCLPVLLWFVVEFVLPGLRQGEKRAVFPAMAASFLLFLFGAFFAFRIGLPFAFRWLVQWNFQHGLHGGWRVGYYIDFVTQVAMVFGLTFQLPVVVFVLISLGVLTYKTMSESRSYAIIIILTVAAFLTPPDPITLILLGGPLCVLYEICIWIAWFQEKGRVKRDAAEAKLREEERVRKEAEHARKMEELARLTTSESDPSQELVSTGELPGDHSLTGPETPAEETTLGSHDDPYHDWGHPDDPHHGHAAEFAMIDINHASIEELQRLPGIGPKLAQRIIDARPFYSQEELEYHAHLPQSVIKLILDRVYFH